MMMMKKKKEKDDDDGDTDNIIDNACANTTSCYYLLHLITYVKAKLGILRTTRPLLLVLPTK